MNDGFPMVSLGDVLIEAGERISLNPDELYKQVTVRLWGKGAVLRAEVLGAEIAAAKQVLVRANQFIVSRIDARNGAFALIPEYLDGAVVSGDFPVFAANPSRIIPSYLGWLSKTQGFVDICRNASEGTTNRKRLKEDRFLAAPIPLPSLAEQQRIVMWIEELAGKIGVTQRLRWESVQEASKVMAAAIGGEMDRLHKCGWASSRVGDLTSLITSGPRNFASKYTQSGLRFYRAQDLGGDGRIVDENVVHVDMPQGMTTRAIVQPGDLLVVITGATIGRSALVQDHHPTGIVSQHVGLIRPDKLRMESAFLHYSLHGDGWTGGQLDGLKYGQGKPGLNLTNLRNLTLPLPPPKEQRRIVVHLDALQAKVDALKRLQEQTAAELDALLPSVLDRAFSGKM